MGDRKWGWVGLAAALVGLFWVTVGSRRSSASDPPRPIPGDPLPWTTPAAQVGSGGCSAMSCHGSPTLIPGSSVLRNEHTTWLTLDPHARAYRRLFAPESKSIARRLSRPSEPAVPAHRDQRCLACHAIPETEPVANDRAVLVRDGVGCESCHGPAERWLGTHMTYGWDALPPETKEQLGMYQTKDLVRRAEVCARCHVGGPERDVNHDLIAAGHPALKFEFSGFLANMPAHWVEKSPNREPTFPARAWAIGQVVTARSAVELLRTRALEAERNPERWPEFAEYECASCHRDLAKPSRDALLPTPLLGKVTWGTWNYPMVSALARSGTDPAPFSHAARFGLLRTAMEVADPDRQAVADQAGEASDALAQWLRSLRTERFTPTRVKAIAESVKAPNPYALPGGDHDAQQYLALVPLRQALPPNDPDRAKIAPWIEALRQRLGLYPIRLWQLSSPSVSLNRGNSPPRPLSWTAEHRGELPSIAH
jgi:hypothetical protein